MNTHAHTACTYACMHSLLTNAYTCTHSRHACMHALMQEEHSDYHYTYRWKTAARMETYSDFLCSSWLKLWMADGMEELSYCISILSRSVTSVGLSAVKLQSEWLCLVSQTCVQSVSNDCTCTHAPPTQADTHADTHTHMHAHTHARTHTQSQ